MKYTYQCPKCNNDLTESSDQQGLTREHDQIAFPIEDGIPVLILKKRTEW